MCQKGRRERGKMRAETIAPTRKESVDAFLSLRSLLVLQI
jgi:hypothetical protein